MNVLFASLFLGSIGSGYALYGKKQSSWPPMIGGVLIMAASYFCTTALSMFVVTAGLMAAIHYSLQRGWFR